MTGPVVVQQTPAAVDIDGVAGDALTFAVSCSVSSAPYDLTGMTVVVEALSHNTRLTRSIAYNVADPTTGVITVTLTEDDTMALAGSGAWALTVNSQTFVAGSTSFVDRLA